MTSFSHTPEFSLTPEQLAVVNHEQGPALVFAVAGAGKTTAMVHRIERIVRERQVSASKILATSFSRASVEELKTRLQTWEHCSNVKPMTLHGLGWRVMRQLQKNGILDSRWQMPGSEENSLLIYFQTLKAARARKADFGDLDNLDPEDFLNWVGMCKGRLEYADLQTADLPEQALTLASQAKAPKGQPDYLSLYKLFEDLRTDMGLLTFDDLLLGCWEAFQRHPQVLESWQQSFDCLLVDEFQDINLAQSEILDAMAAKHRQYMAIGDDDQTIYQWRGASPSFILDFDKRYQATRYLLSDNFRSPAGPLVIANAVIQHNERRAAKRLELTAGLEGITQLQLCDDTATQGREVANTIQKCLKSGHRPQDIAVLVRTYSQTPFIERALIDAGLSYHLPDGKLFYQRPEIRDLLSYVALSALDITLASGNKLSEEETGLWNRHWNRIRNRPGRYFSNQLSQDIQRMISEGLSLRQALTRFAVKCESYMADRLHTLVDILNNLGEALTEQRNAHDTLSQLERRLGWCDWLQSSSLEQGNERAENVRAFLIFSQTTGSLSDLLTELRRLSEAQKESRRRPQNSLTLTSIHRAKGLEWPVVIVPGCNDGVFPPLRESRGEGDIEAERRLLYVALTRSRSELYLFYSRETPLSPFLRAADPNGLIQKVGRLQTLISQPEWTWLQVLQLIQLVEQLNLQRYFQTWYQFDEGRLRQIQGLLNQLERDQDWRMACISPASRQIWCQGEAAARVSLTAEERTALNELLHPPESALEPGQVRHARFGLGTVVKAAVGSRGDMMLIRFNGRGKMQLPTDDPELSL